MKHLALLSVLLLGACAPSPSEEPAASTHPAPQPEITWNEETVAPALAERKVFQPQILEDGASTRFLIWREKNEESTGSDLYLSRRPAHADEFTAPLRINDAPGTVLSWNHDENRAALALAASGDLAVAWNSTQGNVRAAISTDGGVSFAPSLRLNQDTEPAYHGFPSIDFDADGVLHAVWIDSRAAEPRGAEEPAEIYYGRVENGVVSERSLTADRDDSACGCCSTDLSISGEQMTVVFRNADNDGYRDIFRVMGTTTGELGPAERLGPQTWKLGGCPSAGPVTVADTTFWNEASTGDRRTLAASSIESSWPVLETSTEEGEEWKVRLPPRRVESTDRPLVFVPGNTSGKLVEGVAESWSPVASDVPQWATGALVSAGRLVVVGSVEGALQIASRPEPISGLL